MNVIEFPQKEFHFPIFKEFNNVGEEEEGSLGFISKDQKIVKMHSDLLNQNQKCLQKGTIQILSSFPCKS